MIAGLSVSTVVAGQFAGWNYGLANGWSNMFVATVFSAVLYLGLAFCVAELSASLPSAGGFGAYSQAAFGRFPGFLTGFAVFAALAIGTGVAANFVSNYVTSLLGVGGWPVKLAIFVLVIVVHLCGVGEALGLVMAAGVVAVLALVLFCLACIPHFQLANLFDHGQAPPLSLSAVFHSIPFAIWLFLGLEQAATASEEAVDPGRTMPRALLVSIAILALTACGVLLFAPGAAGTTKVAVADDPLYMALGFGTGAAPAGLLPKVVALGAIFGLFATFFSLCYAASRQLFSLARAFPRCSGRPTGAARRSRRCSLSGLSACPFQRSRPTRSCLASCSFWPQAMSWSLQPSSPCGSGAPILRDRSAYRSAAWRRQSRLLWRRSLRLPVSNSPGQC
jgi:ethanolamine permease